MRGRDLLEQRRRFRQVLADCIGESARAPQKNSAVPVIIAGGYEFISLLLVRLFCKSTNPLNAVFQYAPRLDVAIAGFGTCWHDPEHYDVFSGRGQRDTAAECCEKMRLIADDVIRGKDAEHSVW